MVAHIQVQAVSAALLHRKFAAIGGRGRHPAGSRCRDGGGFRRQRLQGRGIRCRVEVRPAVVVPEDAVTLAGEDHRGDDLGVVLGEPARQAHDVQLPVLELARPEQMVAVLHDETLPGEVGGFVADGFRLGQRRPVRALGGDGRTLDHRFFQQPASRLFPDEQVPVPVIVQQGLRLPVVPDPEFLELQGDALGVFLHGKPGLCRFFRENQFFHVVRGRTLHPDADGVVRKRGEDQRSRRCADTHVGPAAQQELRGRQKKQESFHGYQSLEWMNSEGVMPNCCWKCLVKYDGEVYPTR